MLIQLPTMQRAYIQSTLNFNQEFYIWSSFDLILLLHISSNYTIKIITIYYSYYKKKLGIILIKSAHNIFLLWPPLKLLLLPNALSDYIVKFAAHHPYYKDKLVDNLIQHFGCATNCLCFLCDWSNLSVAFFLTYNGDICIAKPDLITKKREPPKTFLYLLLDIFQLPSLIISLTLLIIYLPIFKNLAMF